MEEIVEEMKKSCCFDASFTPVEPERNIEYLALMRSYLKR